MTKGQHLIGKVVGGCVLEKELGHGGSSAVFLAYQGTAEQKVAVKVFLPHSTMETKVLKDFYKRFLLEAEAVSELDHPNILPVYSYGEEDGLPYIIMPYVEGGTLQEYLSTHGPLSLTEAELYLEQIAAALDYAHEHGRVHCDVKPANILLDRDHHVMLSDFGIARVIEPDAPSQQNARPETLMGTPDYISPEQALGQRLDGRSDIYSLGVTLFTLLAGSPPFKASTSIAVALMHLHEPPPLLGLMRVEISPQIDRVMRKALAKTPEERFQTACEFSEAFSQAIKATKKEVVVSRQPVIRLRPVVAASRIFGLPRIALTIALVLLVAVGATVGLLASHLRQNDPASLKPGSSVTPAGGLTDRLINDPEDWPIGSAFFFKNGQYHIKNESAQGVALALYGDHQYANFSLTVTTSEVHGSHNSGDFYGVIFRATADQSHYYLFEVTPWGSPGYFFLRFDGKWQLLSYANAPSLKGGQNNTLTVEARGNSFAFFINNQSVGKAASDSLKSPFSSGEIGLCVEQQGTEVAFSNLQITVLPSKK